MFFYEIEYGQYPCYQTFGRVYNKDYFKLVINLKLQYFTICEEKKSSLPNYRINLLLFLNKSRNLILRS